MTLWFASFICFLQRIEQRIINEHTGKKLKRKDVLRSLPLYKIKRRRDHPFGLCGFVRDTKGSSKNCTMFSLLSRRGKLYEFTFSALVLSRGGPTV
jgi:hypothetical protein